jgi:hypothetical protein
MSDHLPEPFDVAELRRILRDQRLRMLPPAPLQLLFDRIRRIRERHALRTHTLRTPEVIAGWHDSVAASAADNLADVLPRIPRGDPEGDKALEELRRAIFFAREYLDPPPLVVPARVSWHDFAFDLAQAYIFAVQVAWPQERTLGISNDGPVARFVAALVPYLTGQAAPTANAVSVHLKQQLRARRARGARPGSNPNRSATRVEPEQERDPGQI